MKTFIFISLIFHIVTLYVVYYLYKQTQLLRQLNLQDVKSLLENTVTTIKVENERLQKSLKNSQLNDLSKQPSESCTQSNTTIIDEPSNRKTKTTTIPAYSNELEQSAMAEQSIQLNTDVKDSYQPSLHGQVLQLYEKGVTNEQIAQTLNCGKTEVDLILRFHQNN